MPKTHTKINQLAGETLKGFAYANNTDKELVDDVQAIRDVVTHHTEIIRDYDSTSTNLSFTGSGVNNLSIDVLNVQTPTTITIDSQDNYSGLYFSGTGTNDAIVNYSIYNGTRPIYFTFGIQASSEEISTGSGGFLGTPQNGELFTTGSGATFKFISYDIGSDIISAYDVSTSPAPAPADVFTGAISGATVTLANIFTTTGNEVGQWSDSLSNNGVWTIQLASPHSIGIIPNTVDVTFNTIGHIVGDFWSLLYSKGSIVYDVQSQSGSLISGETLNGSLGSTAVFGYQFGTGQVALTQITGNPALGIGSETFTGSISGNTINLDNPITYTDTYSATDGVTTTQYNIVQTDTNPNIFGNLFTWGSSTGHTIGDQWQLTFPIVNIETGYETQQIVFPNVPFPLEGSTIYAEDVNGKVAIGTFDLAPFGQDSKTAGIVSLYTDGSQSTFTESKGLASMNLYDSATNKLMDVTYSGDVFHLQGYNGSSGFGININANNATYQTNSTTFTLPNQVNGAGYVVTDVNGNGVLTLEPAAGGTVNPVNGTINIGPDIGLGGNLIQDTVILTNSFNINIHGNDAAGNDTGIVYFKNSLNGLTGYAGSYSNIAGYNKSGVYTTGLNQHLAVLGFYDGTGSISNASFTIHEHNMNTAESKKNTRLSESSSGLSLYSDTIDVNGANIQHVENYQNSNPFGPSNGFLISKVVDLNAPGQIQLIQSQDTINGRIVEEIHDITPNVQKRFFLNDGVNTHILKFTTTDIESSQYQNSRDDSGINYPTNFLYTDGVGKFQATQLGRGTYSLAAYADDTAAATGGVLPGRLYQTDGTGAAPLNVAGIVMIKQ